MNRHENAGMPEMSQFLKRDLQLWLMGFLIMIVLVAGVAGLVLPLLTRMPNQVQFEAKYLPQLLSGLLALVVLLNIYIAQQRRALLISQMEVARKAAYTQRVERLSFIDPATRAFTREYLDYVLRTEAQTMNRFGRAMTIILARASDSRNRLDVSEDALALGAAQVLRSNFRGSDYIIRYRAEEFVLVLPDTPLPNARRALDRMPARTEAWNLHSGQDFELKLECRLSECAPGGDPWELVSKLDRETLPSFLPDAAVQMDTTAPCSIM